MFSANFVRKVVLVHGEANEMSRLKAALIREYELGLSLGLILSARWF
jgi:Cft2 family RNA processing exonuclease